MSRPSFATRRRSSISAAPSCRHCWQRGDNRGQVASGARPRQRGKSLILSPYVFKKWRGAIAGWRIELLATDLSGAALNKARHGLYSQFEVQRGLPIKLLVKYFMQLGEAWQIAPDIRGMVKFRRFNLLSDLASLGRFDVILCRNVLIYFDQDTKIDMLHRLAEALSSDGYLILGAA